MKKKKGYLSDWILWGLTVILLIPTGYRTIQLMSLTLPPADWWLGLFALFAFDAGTVGWTIYLIHAAKSDQQESIAGAMIVVDLIGVAASYIGDTVYEGAARGTLGRSDVAPWAIIIQAVIIVANIAAVIAAKVADPDARLVRKERRAYYTIHEKRLEYIEGEADTVATQIAVAELERWKANTLAAWNVSPVQQPSAPASLPTAPPAQLTVTPQPAPATQPLQPPAGNISAFPGVTLNQPTAQPSADGGSDPNL